MDTVEVLIPTLCPSPCPFHPYLCHFFLLVRTKCRDSGKSGTIVSLCSSSWTEPSELPLGWCHSQQLSLDPGPLLKRGFLGGCFWLGEMLDFFLCIGLELGQIKVWGRKTQKIRLEFVLSSVYAHPELVSSLWPHFPLRKSERGEGGETVQRRGGLKLRGFHSQVGELNPNRQKKYSLIPVVSWHFQGAIWSTFFW